MFWLEIKLMNFGSMGWSSNQLSHTSQGTYKVILIYYCSLNCQAKLVTLKGMVESRWIEDLFPFTTKYPEQNLAHWFYCTFLPHIPSLIAYCIAWPPPLVCSQRRPPIPLTHQIQHLFSVSVFIATTKFLCALLFLTLPPSVTSSTLQGIHFIFSAVPFLCVLAL